MKSIINLFIIHSFPVVFIQNSVLAQQTWQEFDSIRQVYMERQSYDTALVYAEKALQSVKEKTGENDTLYANMIRNTGSVYYFLKKYNLAIEYSLREKDIRTKVQGKRNPNYSNVLNNLGYFYYITGNYYAAEPFFTEAKNLNKEVLGEKHLYYANSLNNLASLYRVMGNYTAAEPLYLEAKNICKEVLGEKHPDYATTINNLAVIYMIMGNYSAAESLYFEAKNICKKVLGETHPDYATSVINLASLYYLMGNYIAAEPLLLEAKNIYKEVLDDKHPDYAQSLNNLAELYRVMGNYPAAETLFLEAKKIKKEVLGEKHPEFALSLHNLAALYDDMGNFPAAETLYFEAKNIRKEVLGEKHPDYASSLNNLAELYQTLGNYNASEPLYLEAKSIFKEVLGEKHPDYAQSLNNIAVLYDAMGNYHAAAPLYLECLEIINSDIAQNFAFLSEKEKEMYFKTQAGAFADFYSFSLKRKVEDSGITITVYNNVVKNKGLLLKSSTAMRFAILNSGDTALISKYENWITTKTEISKLYSTEISKRSKDPKILEQQANVLEKDLVRSSQLFSDFEKLQNLTWKGVKKSLKPGEAAIEFIRFKLPITGYRSPTTDYQDTMLYCALLVKPDSKFPEMIKLFEEKQILEILNAASGNNFNQVNSIYGTNLKTNDALYTLIWQPLEKYLEGVKTVYYSPDGLLHKISFAAIAKDKDVLLCDEYKLQQMSSTGKLAIPESVIIAQELTAGIFGGIEYSTDTSTHKLWQYLSGTLTEAEGIKNKLESGKVPVALYTGKNATEESFKQLFGSNQTLSVPNNSGADRSLQPSILHIATHGFFYPDPQGHLAKGSAISKDVDSEYSNLAGQSETMLAFRGGTTGFGLWQFVKNKNPLMRSGLVMAGANNVWNQRFVGQGEDGVLTAQEVTQLDMRKTQLVVMSACETGLGEIKGSEGVYGLQRAFKMAGVKYIIMSLWQVPDKETEEFMTMFYTKFLKQKDIRKAFSETQAEMRKKYDPYYWGAFVLIE